MLAAIAKLPGAAKLALVALAVISTAAFSGFSAHDLAQYYVLFVFLSSIISGMPGPDEDLHGWKFWHTWAYRSGHLIVANGTAYFMHERNWKDIGGDQRLKTGGGNRE